MEQVKANNVAAVLARVASYGGQLAAVFHHYALIADNVPRGFEASIIMLDATVAALKQVLGLVSDDAESSDGMKLFNEAGLVYVLLLAQECANSLAEVEPRLVEACLERKERNAKRKQSKKVSSKKLVIQVDPLSLKLDEKKFLETMEKAKWSLVFSDMVRCMDRLYDLQLHILLVFQVVKVGALSKVLTSGKVDIQSIVTYHDRINRTADMIGLKPPGRSTYRCIRVGRRDSLSDRSSDSSSGIDTDNSSIILKRKKRLPQKAGPPSAPPARRLGVPPPAPTPPALSSGPTIKSSPIISLKVPYPSLTAVSPKSGPLVDNGNPPAYFESKPTIMTVPSSVSGSTLVGTMSQNASVTSPQLDSVEKKTTASVYPDEKALTPEKEKIDTVQIVKPQTPEGRLFKSPSNGLGFRFKSFFRSKTSLAAEMKRTLSDSESDLVAFVIQKHDMRKVPHSAFHELEATHMRTILSQLNDNTWYKTFSSLDSSEHASVGRILRPWINGRLFERELIVLKVVEKNRLNAWVALLGEVLRNRPFAPMANGRILLAIVREKFVDGKPLKEACPRLGPPPPPPVPFSPMPMRSAVLVPPMPYTPPRRTMISDLRGPPPPPSIQVWPSSNSNHLPGPPPIPGRGPPPPSLNHPPGVKSNPIRISDTPPVSNAEAIAALTTYNEYTMRLSEPVDPSVPRCWSRVAVTQESSEKHLIVQRVQRFQNTGGNVIEAKLRITEQQSGQVTRLMDDLKCAERDARFEWCWAELSLYDHNGEIMDFIPKGTCHVANTARLIHLIAKRCLKASYKPLDVYNVLIKPVPRPPPMPTPPGVVHLCPSKPIKKKTAKYVSSSSDSDSSYYSSDSSIGQVRSRMRKYKAKKARRDDKRRRFISDSDTDNSSDSEVEDMIRVKVNLKKDDDIVKVLLDLWTANVEIEGKGKGKVGG